MSIASAGPGNYSATATWTGGVVPGPADTIVVNHQITLDGNFSCAGIDPTGTGSIIAANSQYRILVGIGGRPSFVAKPLVL